MRRCSSNGTPGSGDALVADAAEDDPARDRLALVGRPADAAVRRRARSGRARSPRPAPSPRIATGERRSAARIARGLPAGSRVAYSRRCSTLRRARRRVALERRLRSPGRARGRPGRRSTSAPASSPSSSSLGRRQRRLHRPAAAERRRSRGSRSRRSPAIAASVVSVGRELLGRERQHARDVERDVAVPDHDRPLAGEVERQVLEVGVAVVPGDELGRRPGAGQVLAGDAELPVGLRADRVDDRVVEPQRARRARRPGRPRRCRRSGSPGCAAIFSNARETALMFGWSGATPSRTSPHGVGSRSIMSTSTRSSLAQQARRPRRSPAGPEPTTATRRLSVPLTCAMLRNMKVVLAGLLLRPLCRLRGGDSNGEQFAIYHLETAIGRPKSEGELTCGPPRPVCPGVVEQPPPHLFRYAGAARPGADGRRHRPCKCPARDRLRDWRTTVVVNLTAEGTCGRLPG